jgi:hypothetical protein
MVAAPGCRDCLGLNLESSVVDVEKTCAAGPADTKVESQGRQKVESQGRQKVESQGRLVSQGGRQASRCIVDEFSRLNEFVTGCSPFIGRRDLPALIRM